MRKLYYVDIPNSNNIDDSWVNIDVFYTREEALKFVKNKLGADENGNINLISELEEEEEE